LTLNANLHVNGNVTADWKSFLIDHPTKPGKKLQYGSLEGPEHGVYVRGQSNTALIVLPDYWWALVDLDTITVQLTPQSFYQQLYVNRIQNNVIYVSNAAGDEFDYFFTVNAERKDVDKLIVET